MYYGIKPIVQVHVHPVAAHPLDVPPPHARWSYESRNKIRELLRHLGAFRERSSSRLLLSRISSYISLPSRPLRVRCAASRPRVSLAPAMRSFHGGDSIRIAVPCNDGEP